ncbi:MAG: ribosome maturation factor RimP [Deltaproteobacteria bacterium]|jgi:ribosome maturation factor RimP|nr:ribosome maturation factor RimP [Deltaproteobacteria bacterium]
MENLNLTDRIAALAEPLLSSLGLALWGIEYLPGSRAVARLYIERAGLSAGMDSEEAGIDECAQASRLIGLALEVEDFIPSAYVLEVSTPGLERRFFRPAQLAAAQGRRVEVTLSEAVNANGRKKYAGCLVEGRITESGDWRFDLTVDEPAAAEEARLAFLWSKTRQARQLYDPPAKEKPGKKSGGKPGAEPAPAQARKRNG